MCRIPCWLIFLTVLTTLLADALALPALAPGGSAGRGPQAGAGPRDPLPPGAVARWGSLSLRHVGEVSLLTFSADGKSLLSLGADMEVCRWDPVSGKELARVPRRGIAIPHHVVYRTVMLRGVQVAQMERGSSFFASAALTRDGKVLAELTRQGKAQLWEIATGKEVRSFEFAGGPGHALAFSPDGKFFAAGDMEEQEGLVRLWEVATGKQLRLLKAGKDRIPHILAFSPDSRTLAGAVGNEIRIWDLVSGKRLRLYQGHEDVILALAFAPDGKTLASAGRDRTIRIWESGSEEELTKLAGPECAPLSQAFSPNGRELATGWEDKVIRVWEVASGAELRQLEGHRSQVSMLAYSPDGKTLASADGDGTVRLWAAHTGKPRLSTVESGKVAGLTLLDGGRTCVVRGEDGTVQHVELIGGKELRRFCINPENMTNLTLAPDGLGAALVSNEDGSIRLWDGPAGKEVAKLTGHPDGVSQLSYSHDGKLLASAGADGFLKVWALATGKELFRAEVPDAVPVLLFSADDRVLAAAVGGDLCLWETATGKRRLTFRGVSGGPGTMALSADGRLLATGGQDEVVRLWDTATGEMVRGLLGHRGDINALAFAPRGKLLASASEDGTVRLWDVAGGAEVGRLEGHRGGVLALAFTPDGKRLLTGGKDTTVVVWDVAAAPRPKARPAPPRGDAVRLWDELGSADAEAAYRAVGELVRLGDEGVQQLRGRLRPVPAVGVQQIERLIADLGDRNFARRQAAMKALENLEGQAESALRKALTWPLVAETKERLERLLRQLEGPVTAAGALRVLRAVEVLERIGTDEARQGLRELAAGGAGARLTEAARRALQRLNARAATP